MGCKYRRERKEIKGHASSMVIIKFRDELDEEKFARVKGILASDPKVRDIHYRGKKISFQAGDGADLDFLVDVLEKNSFLIEE
ncbi:MAG: hypothetical protein A2Y33_09345 [Spirochaetes bacterium GWF1_51_8]|nr:MAG: hypothetical protein A2Y33_09345 [Spirochaetes bacterium GWF1_51_8]